MLYVGDKSSDAKSIRKRLKGLYNTVSIPNPDEPIFGAVTFHLRCLVPTKSDFEGICKMFRKNLIAIISASDVMLANTANDLRV